MKLNLELDMLKGIQSASSLVGFLMDELLDNQLLEKGNFTLKLSFFNIKEAIEEILHILKVQLEARGNSVYVQIDELIPD